MTHHHRVRPSRWRHILAALTATVVSILNLDSAQVGDVDATTIEARFSSNVTATDYTAGVTIKTNSVAQTINSAARQADHAIVHFVIAAAVDVDDTVTWEYDDDLGDYADDQANPMGDIIATTATNYVGSHLYFDTADDAVWSGAL